MFKKKDWSRKKKYTKKSSINDSKPIVTLSVLYMDDYLEHMRLFYYYMNEKYGDLGLQGDALFNGIPLIQHENTRIGYKEVNLHSSNQTIRKYVKPGDGYNFTKVIRESISNIIIGMNIILHDNAKHDKELNGIKLFDPYKHMIQCSYNENTCTILLKFSYYQLLDIIDKYNKLTSKSTLSAIDDDFISIIRGIISNFNLVTVPKDYIRFASNTVQYNAVEGNVRILFRDFLDSDIPLSEMRICVYYESSNDIPESLKKFEIARKSNSYLFIVSFTEIGEFYSLISSVTNIEESTQFTSVLESIKSSIQSINNTEDGTNETSFKVDEELPLYDGIDEVLDD